MFEVKGKAQPLAAFNVLGPSDASSFEDMSHLHAPFVGRTAELAQLRSILAETREGDGTTVVVVGEPGVGKTRLVGEVVDHDTEAFQVIRGSARVVGEQPLGVLVEA